MYSLIIAYILSLKFTVGVTPGEFISFLIAFLLESSSLNPFFFVLLVGSVEVLLVESD